MEELNAEAWNTLTPEVEVEFKFQPLGVFGPLSTPVCSISALARLALQRGSEAGGCSKGPEDVEGVGSKPKANWRICAWRGGELAGLTGPDGLINSCIQVGLFH